MLSGLFSYLTDMVSARASGLGNVIQRCCRGTLQHTEGITDHLDDYLREQFWKNTWKVMEN